MAADYATHAGASASTRGASVHGTGAGVGDLLGHMFGEAKCLVTDYAELAVLDAGRAGVTLAGLLVVAVLLVTAWMGFVAALIVWMFAEGVSWPLAIAIAALVNILAAAAVGWYMRRLLKDLPFKALLRQLRGEDPPPAPVARPELRPEP
jgi:uncharacterized membrane protein YqjE